MNENQLRVAMGKLDNPITASVELAAEFNTEVPSVVLFLYMGDTRYEWYPNSDEPMSPSQALSVFAHAARNGRFIATGNPRDWQDIGDPIWIPANRVDQVQIAK